MLIGRPVLLHRCMAVPFLLGALLLLGPASRCLAAVAEAPAGAPAAVIVVNGKRLPIVRTCDADRYDCTVTQAPGAPSSIYWGWKDDRNHYRLDVGPAGISLTRVLNGQAQKLASAAGAFISRVRPTPILLRRRAHLLCVIVGGTTAIECMDSSFGAGAVAGERITADKYQPADDIYFTDDFMRTAQERDLGEWSKVSGAWQFHSVKEINPHADIRLSVNPFSLGGSDPESAIVKAGFPFWCDYDFGVSVKSEGAWGGLIFSYKDPHSYFLLRMDLRATRPSPSSIQLVRVSPAGEKVLASGLVRAAAGQWYRLQVRTIGTRIQAVLDGDVVFDVVDSRSCGGPVGLYTRGAVQTYFDDVSVASAGVYPLDRAAALRRGGHPADGVWKTEAEPGASTPGYEGPVGLTEKGSGAARYLLGDAGWGRGVIQARITPEGGAGWAGLYFGYRDSANWYLARWPVGPGSATPERRLQVIRCLDGKKLVIGESPGLLAPGSSHDLQIDATPPGAVHFSLDGRLRLRLRMPQPAVGSAGLYTLGLRRTVFQSLTLRETRDAHLEQQIANQVYANDRFMLSWSSSKGQWFPATVTADLLKRWSIAQANGADVPPAYWDKGDFFDAYTITIPLQIGLVLVFNADQQDFTSGYSLSVEPGGPAAVSVRLRRHDQLLKTRTIPAAQATGFIEMHHSGDVIWVMQGDRELFSFTDRAALAGRQVGLVTPIYAHPAAGSPAPATPAPFDLASVQVERENIADYPFEEANCDWDSYGDWVVTNRFSCTPTWSFMSAMGDRASVLWNKYEYEGDMTLEFYAGMKMGPNPAMYYPRVGDLNATICGDGRDLSSGYSYLVGAWDPEWSEKWTRLLRQDATAVQTDHYTVPRDRENSGEREIAVPWIAAGRPIHGAWYYMKIQRVGSHIDCYFDNVKVLSYDDPKPLNGRFLALWTQMDQIVIARARITYQKRVAPHRLLPPAASSLTPPSAPKTARPGLMPVALPTAPAAPVPMLAAATHPGLFENFDRPGSEWEGTSSPQDVAVERVAGGSGGKGAYLRVTNVAPGGDLGVKIPVPQGLDAGRVLLAFDYCFPPQAKVNLYITIGETECFVRMTGGGEDDPLLPLLGDLPLQADSMWHHASFDLAAAVDHLRSALATSTGALPVQDIRVGYFHEGYLRAGFGGNGPDAWYGMDNFMLGTQSISAPALAWGLPAAASPTSASPAPTSASPAPAAALVPGGKQIRAAALKSATLPAGQVPAAPLFAFACDHSPDTEPAVGHPVHETTRTMQGLSPGLWFAHVRFQRPDGAWSVAAHLPFVVLSGPPKLQLLNEPPGGHWGGSPIEMSVGPAEYLPLDIAHTTVTVNGQALDHPARFLEYDAPKGRLTLDLQGAGLVFTDKQPVKVSVQAASAEGPASTVGASLVMDLASDKRPPDAPVVSSGGFSEGFEHGIGTWAGGTALVVRDTTTAASGNASVEIVNKTVGGSFAAYALGQAFSAGRLPLLRFDYRMPDTICLNWALTTSQTGVGIGFTDPDDSYPVTESVPGVVRDDQWHHAEVNLHTALDGLRFAPGQYDVSSLMLGDRGYSGAKPGARCWFDNFQLVPTVSGAAGFTISWSATDCSGIKAYRYAWSAKPDDTPTTLLPGATTSFTFKDVAEGPMYLHIQAQDGAGNWSSVTHTPFLVDNTPPVLAVPPAAPVKLSSSFWTVGVADAGPAGLDPVSLQVSVNGKPYPLQQFVTTYDAAHKTLSWEWPLGTGLFDGPVPDGQPVDFTVGPVKDFAGNTAPGGTFKYVVDRAGDREPPRAPTMNAGGADRVCLDTFTRDMDQWAPYGPGPLPERVLDPDRQDYCLRLSTSGTYGYYARPTAFDVVKTPWIAFDYRCPAGMGLYFMVYTGTWYVVPLSGNYTSYTNLPAVDGFKADGKWHSIAFNLLDRLRGAGLNAPSLPVIYLAIWHYGTAVGGTYDIDNFQIFGAGKPDLQVSWSAADATGIQAYRWRADPDPEIGMEGGAQTADRQVSLSGLKPGPWFIRVRAEDGAGNWSAPALLGYAVEPPKP